MFDPMTLGLLLEGVGSAAAIPAASTALAATAAPMATGAMLGIGEAGLTGAAATNAAFGAAAPAAAAPLAGIPAAAAPTMSEAAGGFAGIVNPAAAGGMPQSYGLIPPPGAPGLDPNALTPGLQMPGADQMALPPQQAGEANLRMPLGGAPAPMTSSPPSAIGLTKEQMAMLSMLSPQQKQQAAAQAQAHAPAGQAARPPGVANFGQQAMVGRAPSLGQLINGRR